MRTVNQCIFKLIWTVFFVDCRYRKEITELLYLLCNGIISHGAPIEGVRVFADHARGNKCKQIAPTIFARCVAFQACTYTPSVAPDKSQLF